MKIGIYSGSFNPVHIGHIALADYIVRMGYVEEVWMIRSLLNPLKSSDDMMSDDVRLHMLELAIEGHQGLRISTIEDELPLPNYTITTLQTLKNRFPEHEFYLIVGADNWQIFNKWRDWETILSDFHLIVYPRPGYPLDKKKTENVQFVDAQLYDISSTQIRECLERGESLKGLVPDAVANYLIQIYKQTNN